MTKKKLIRQKFRESVFKRDGYKCVFCDTKENLDAHHITDRNEMPNGGYVLENGITLCSDHHILAEGFHNGNLIYGWLPEDMYKAIKTSYNEAYRKSLELK